MCVVGNEASRTENAGECQLNSDCPKSCLCDDTVIDCSGIKLTHLPDKLPAYTTHL